MTGFGRATAAGSNFSIAVELKTVNNRFLDVNLRLGGELQSLEANIKRVIGNRLSRGRVDRLPATQTDERGKMRGCRQGGLQIGALHRADEMNLGSGGEPGREMGPKVRHRDDKIGGRDEIRDLGKQVVAKGGGESFDVFGPDWHVTGAFECRDQTVAGGRRRQKA